MLTTGDIVNGIISANSEVSSGSERGSSLQPPTEARSAAHLRDDLMKRFHIEVDREAGSVTLELHGASRIEFIRAANSVIGDIYGRRAVSDLSLDRWSHDAPFTRQEEKATLAVQGAAPDSTNMSRTAQNAAGLNNVPGCDLAAAHTAYLLATGEDLFKTLHVRAETGVFRFYRDGLHQYFDFTDAPFRDVAASKRLG